MIPVIEAFVRTVVFMDGLREEGRIRDYALVGGLALSAWADPRNTKDVEGRPDIDSLMKKADRRKLKTLAKRHLLLAKLESVFKKDRRQVGSVF